MHKQLSQMSRLLMAGTLALSSTLSMAAEPKNNAISAEEVAFRNSLTDAQRAKLFALEAAIVKKDMLVQLTKPTKGLLPLEVAKEELALFKRQEQAFTAQVAATESLLKVLTPEQQKDFEELGFRSVEKTLKK